MAINFNAIPDTAGFDLPEPGLYRMHVDKAEMKIAFIPTDPLELNLTCTLFNENGKNCGKFFDKFKDNDTKAQIYKIGRFVKAAGLELSGEVALKDICKLVQDLEVIVDINHYTSPKNKTYAQANIFGAGCYYPVSEYSALLKATGGAVIQDTPTPAPKQTPAQAIAEITEDLENFDTEENEEDKGEY